MENTFENEEVIVPGVNAEQNEPIESEGTEAVFEEEVDETEGGEELPEEETDEREEA